MMSDLELIKQIKRQIGKRLMLCELDSVMKGTVRCYVLNKQQQLIGLNLDQCKLDDISFLSQFTQLQVLSLNHNKITDLSALKELKNLTKLNLSNNQITDLVSLKELTSLTTLYLSSNKIIELAALKDMEGLTKLGLGSNKITNISALIKLKNLTTLYLSSNKITELGTLKYLKSLTCLFLNFNQITEFSALKELKRLTTLSLADNQIYELPAWSLDFRLEIKWLRLSGDDERNFYVFGNPLEFPPPEIIQQGNAAIEAYFESLKKEYVTHHAENVIGASDSCNVSFPCKLNELKILFIGDGGAGKTSLSKLLRDQTFDPHENQTHGINIDDWKVGDITAHLWDFGGQEILRATHKFFLSKRSLYVLVLDNREERDEERWLKRIESFGGNSPILIVLNKCEQNASYDVDRRDLVRRYSGLQTQDFYSLSCANGQGIEAFKQGLIAAFKRVELINSVLPESWFQVKTALEQQQRQQHYINYEEFQKICQQQQIADTQTQDILARLLHDLGVSVHFEDLALLDTHVLEPKWITEGVYKIITSPQLTEQQGVLNLADLAEILKPRTDLPGFKNLEGLTNAEYIYPPTKYAYLLELMKKFELSYRLNDCAVLIPQLLKPEEPEFAFDDSGQVLRFQILYDYLDDSIMPRFIVALHQDIDNRIQWRKGVLLKNQSFNSQAVVRVNYQDRLLTIVVKGEQKRDYFAVIRKALQDIHASFEWKKTPVELVPLPDNPEFTVEYEDLIGYEQMGKDDYPVGKLRKIYSVLELLNGLVKPEERQKLANVYNYYGDVKQLQANEMTINEQEKTEKMTSYHAQTWEKIIVYLAGLLFIGAIVFLAIRNVSIADKNIAAMLRIILSLVMAVFGAVVPGMLKVSWKGQGFLIRAGGALALFVIAFFGTPNVF